MLLFFLFSCRSIPKGDTSQPDIILVSIDTLRADHVSSYGYERKTTPFIDSLASKGMRFSHAWSTSSWTLPAHTSLLSGTRSLQHKVIEESIPIPNDLPLISETLQNSGWQTGGVVSASFVSRLYGFDRGFDFFEDFGLDGDANKNLQAEISAEHIIARALDWMKGSSIEAGKPTFLFLHFYDAHYECDPPAPFDEMFDRKHSESDINYKNYFYHKETPLTKDELNHQIAQYDEAIRYVDHHLQRLQRIWKEAGRDAIWIVTSDHGEEFGERGSWGHAHTLYKEQVHIPLIVSPTKAIKVEHQHVGIEDIASTIGEIAGVEFKGSGISLLELQNSKRRNFVFETSRFYSNRLAILSDEYKLEWDVVKNTTELFHITTDFKEKYPIEKDQISLELQQSILSYIGNNWKTKTTGTITSKKGYFFIPRSTKEKDIQPIQTLHINQGDSFQVIPFDSNVRFQPKYSSNIFGPFREMGSKQPNENDPLELAQERMTTSDVELSEEIQNQLKILGYMTEE